MTHKVLALLFLLFSAVHAFAQVGTPIPSGQTATINAHGTCRQVTNPDAGTRMVFTGTSDEWASFLNNPNGLVLSQCFSYGYGGWNGWSSCSATCGGGFKGRLRPCIRNPDSVGVDCSLCGGDCWQNQACNTHSCTYYAYGDWSGWAGCSASCGGGSQSRSRACTRYPDGASVDCSYCGGACWKNQTCNTHACPSSGIWATTGVCAFVGQGLENCPASTCPFGADNVLLNGQSISCSPLGTTCSGWQGDTTWTFAFTCQ